MLVKNADVLVQNARTPKLSKARGILVELVDSAIKAGNPSSSIRRWVKVEAEKLWVGDYKVDLNGIGRIITVGGGKA
nr:hypothetical protein [Dehalococcoidia bacterium]